MCLSVHTQNRGHKGSFNLLGLNQKGNKKSNAKNWSHQVHLLKPRQEPILIPIPTFFFWSQKGSGFSKSLLHIVLLKPVLILVAATSWPLTSISSVRAFIPSVPYVTYLLKIRSWKANSNPKLIIRGKGSSLSFPKTQPQALRWASLNYQRKFIVSSTRSH